MIYLDYAAAAPVRSEVVDAMGPFWSDQFAHPSALTSAGLAARNAVEEQRELIATLLHARSDEIIFTSGASESVMLAARIAARLAGLSPNEPNHALIAALDHTIVRQSLTELADFRVNIDEIPSTPTGVVDLSALATLLVQSTVPWWLSFPWVSSDLGTIQSTPEVHQILRQSRRRNPRHSKCFVHIDASQTIGHLPIDVRQLPCDFLSFGGAKIGGPKGIGVLFARRSAVFDPGRQTRTQTAQRIFRPGTEAVPLIVGLGTALKLADDQLATESLRLTQFREIFEHRLKKELPTLRVLGAEVPRAPHITSLLLPGVEAESLLVYLDQDGLAVGIGLACQSASEDPSNALQSLGMGDADLRSVVRISFGYQTSQADVAAAGRILVKRLKWFKQFRMVTVDNLA